MNYLEQMAAALEIHAADRRDELMTTTHTPWRWAAMAENRDDLGFTGVLHHDGGCRGVPGRWSLRPAGAWEKNHGEYCTAGACRAAAAGRMPEDAETMRSRLLGEAIELIPDLLDAQDPDKRHKIANELMDRLQRLANLV